MGKIVTPSSGAGYPYPNTLTLEFSYSELSDHSGHKVSWTVTATDGLSNYYQYLFNAGAWAKVGSGEEWNIWGISTAYISVWGGEQLASGSFEVKHVDSIDVQLKVGGGYYSSVAYEEARTTFALPSVHSAPTGVSGVNLEAPSLSGGTFRSTIVVSGWGTNASQGSWAVVAGPASSASVYGSSTTSSSFNWSTSAFSPATSTTNCRALAWYPRAVNNYGDMTTGSVRYITTPTAPTVTITGSTTTPQLSVYGICKYRGGSTNSTKCDNVALKAWKLDYTQAMGTDFTQFALEADNVGYDHTFSTPIPANTFALGKNYDIQVRAVNYVGAYGQTLTRIFCPSGINGRVTSDLTGAMTIVPSFTYSGGIGSSTITDKMAYYKVKWSTNKSTVDGGGGTETSSFTTDTTVTGLTPGTTYYYRVYGWNVYGLSQVSNTLTYTTKNRFEPSLYTPTSTATGMGANFSITVKTTGGLSENESTVKTLRLYGRPANGAWEQIGEDVTGLSLQAEQSYTFTDAITGALSASGDWEFRVWASNGEDVAYSPSIVLYAPSGILLQRIASVSGSPIQFSFNASATATGDASIYKWNLGYRKIGEAAFTYIETVSDDTEITLSTHNHLDFSTSYEFVVQAYNRYGLGSGFTLPIPTKTPNRFEWSYVSGETQKAVTPSFKTSTKNSSIIDVYYIVRNSLGSVEIDQDLRNKRLRFITQMLNYRPENVASIQFENGKILAYALDGDVYKFGIWDNGTLEETFHNGYEWEKTTYKIPDDDGYVVELIQSVKGLNSSSAFSTTSCEDIMIWETE